MGLINANCCANISTVSDTKVSDNSLAFLQTKMLTYMDRLLNANLNLNKEAFEILYWLLNRDLANDYVQTIKELIPEQKRQQYVEIEHSIEEGWDFAHRSFDIIKLLSRESRHRALIAARRLLKLRLNELRHEGSTPVEENVLEFKRMFHLDDIETELCLFLFMMANWNEFQTFFEHHLQCNHYQGRKWLAIVLNCREAPLVKALNGKLDQIGIIGASCKSVFLGVKHV